MPPQLFSVRATNLYEEELAGSRTVQVKLINVVFKTRSCSLILIQDLTQVISDAKARQEVNKLSQSAAHLEAAITQRQKGIT